MLQHCHFIKRMLPLRARDLPVLTANFELAGYPSPSSKAPPWDLTDTLTAAVAKTRAADQVHNVAEDEMHLPPQYERVKAMGHASTAYLIKSRRNAGPGWEPIHSEYALFIP